VAVEVAVRTSEAAAALAVTATPMRQKHLVVEDQLKHL